MPVGRVIALSADNLRAPRGGPCGTVIVPNAAISAKGAKQVLSAPDPAVQAEAVAIRAAGLARPDAERALPVRRRLAQEARGVFPVWLRKANKEPYARPSSGRPSARQAVGLSRRPQARLRPWIAGASCRSERRMEWQTNIQPPATPMRTLSLK